MNVVEWKWDEMNVKEKQWTTNENVGSFGKETYRFNKKAYSFNKEAYSFNKDITFILNCYPKLASRMGSASPELFFWIWQ